MRWRYPTQCPRVEAPAATPPNPAVPSAQPRLEAGARATAAMAAWVASTPSELSEMAKHCEVRFVLSAVTNNQLPVLSDEQLRAASLSPRESEVLEQTLRSMHDGVLRFAEEALAEGNAGAEAKTDGVRRDGPSMVMVWQRWRSRPPDATPKPIGPAAYPVPARFDPSPAVTRRRFAKFPTP